MMECVVLDVATTAIANADEFCEEPSAPANWKDPEKIAGYVQAAKQKGLADAALDIDLARISGVAVTRIGRQTQGPQILLNRDAGVSEEIKLLEWLADQLTGQTIITFNGFRFDLPLLMRRAMYLSVKFPDLNLDRYRSPHVDVWDRLSHHGAIKAHSLTWYARRLGWTDLHKPLSGAEEARAVQEGRWDELAASLEHDVRACERLARLMGVLPRQEAA